MSGSAHLFGAIRVFDKVKDLVRKPVWVSWRDQPAFYAVTDEFGNAADARGHDWFAKEHGFQDRIGQALRHRGKQRDLAER